MNIVRRIAFRLYIGYFKMLERLRTFWWILNDRCEYCGGELHLWSYKKAECTVCKKLN